MDETLKKMDDLPITASRHRREGFPGQHHIVLPGPIVSAAENHPLLMSLHVTDAGLYPKAQGHRVTRSKGSRTMILIACTAGGGWVLTHGKRQEVQAGDVVWLSPHQSHAYGSNVDDPWTIEWVHFSGRESEAWRDTIMGTDFFLKLPPGMPTGIGLARVYELLDGGYDETRLLMAAGMLRQCLIELLKFKRLRPGLTSAEAVESAADWMRHHLASKLRLDELSKMAGMSSSRFSDLFRQQFGYAPMDWFTRQRILHACRLLDSTREKVEVVGREVGFDDPYYFSRSFRKVMGCSPRGYRAILKG